LVMCSTVPELIIKHGQLDKKRIRDESALNHARFNDDESPACVFGKEDLTNLGKPVRARMQFELC